MPTGIGTHPVGVYAVPSAQTQRSLPSQLT